VPAITDRAVGWAGVETPEIALALLRRLQARTDRIEGFELIAGDVVELAIEHVPGLQRPMQRAFPWHVLIEATSDDPGFDPTLMLAGQLAEALEAGILEDGTIAASEAQAEAMWRIRDSLSEALRTAGPSTAHDISVAVDAMPAFIAHASAEVERAFPGVKATAFGHLGDGNVHFHVRAGSRAAPDWLAREGEAIARLVDDLVTAAGGSISAEHGIGQMKLDEFARLAAPARLHALRAIKQALDPAGLMNPGKLVPGESDQSQAT
jgi:FAD/FMN-containing dehydrogenase